MKARFYGGSLDGVVRNQMSFGKFHVHVADDGRETYARDEELHEHDDRGRLVVLAYTLRQAA